MRARGDIPCLWIGAFYHSLLGGCANQNSIRVTDTESNKTETILINANNDKQQLFLPQ